MSALSWLVLGMLFVGICYIMSDLVIDKIFGANLQIEIQQLELPADEDLMKLTKAQLEEYGRDCGVELDKRKTKANMLKQLKDLLGK